MRCDAPDEDKQYEADSTLDKCKTLAQNADPPHEFIFFSTLDECYTFRTCNTKIKNNKQGTNYRFEGMSSISECKKVHWQILTSLQQLFDDLI